MKVRDKNIQEAVDILDTLEVKGIQNMMKIIKVVQLITEADGETEKEEV